MRNIVTISMPLGLKKQVDKVVAEENYSSVSEFFRDAVRAWENERLVRELKESQRDARMGRFKKLSSFRDLR